MANEIRFNLTLDLAKGNISASFRPGQITPDWGGDNLYEGCITLNTSNYVQLTGGSDLQSGGLCWMRNVSTSASTDPTLTIARSDATNTPFAKVLPGQYMVMRCVTLPMSAISAGTNACVVQYGILDP